MPELPEVEALTRRLVTAIRGRRIRAVHVLRATPLKPQSPATLVRLATGQRIAEVRRRGKHILVELAGGHTIRVHLRMTGELFAAPHPEITKSVRIWFELSGGMALVFRDSRALGRMTIETAEATARALDGLGPEPLSRAFRYEHLATAAARSRQPAKVFLLDQKHVAGLGNIYAAEALFHAGIDPRTPIRDIPEDHLRALHTSIRAVLREAVRCAVMTYARPGTYREADQFGRCVYGREGAPCRACGTLIRRIAQAGRSTYFCPNCQKLLRY